MMKVLHITEIGSIFGGAETYIFFLAKALAERGDENVLVFGKEYPQLECGFSGRKYRVPELAQRWKAFDTSKVIKKIEKESPDVVYFHHVFHPDLVKDVARSFPTAAYLHGVGFTCPSRRRFLKGKLKSCEYPLSAFCQFHAYPQRCMPRNPAKGIPLICNSFRLRNAFKGIGKLVVPSHYLKNVLLKNGFHGDQVEVISYFTFLPEREPRALLPEPPRVLFVGRIDASKGIMHFIKMLELLKADFKAVIIGDGPDIENAREESERAGMDIEFKGYMKQAEINRYYRDSSVIVFPSIYPETFGIVGIEAGAYEKPIVAFDVGGVSEWLKDGENGFLIKPYDIEDMAKKVEILLTDKERAVSMGSSGRKIVEERFSPGVHLDKLLSVFGELC
jgi:glycosyltransferase involved in cell wall biosynthesis